MTILKPDISIAIDFSKVPAGRYVTDGDVSGEVFRDKILMPALAEFNEITVDFDGTEGYGSSFLEEAFGGLIRERGMLLNDVIQRIKFVSEEDPTVIDEVMQYLSEAEAMRLKPGNSQSVA